MCFLFHGNQNHDKGHVGSGHVTFPKMLKISLAKEAALPKRNMTRYFQTALQERKQQ